MQITSKGQVTIPQQVRLRLGLLPHTEVEFELAGDHARIRKVYRSKGLGARGQRALSALSCSRARPRSSAALSPVLFVA